MDRTFKGRAQRIDDYDLPRIGALIGVGEDEIHAILDVESSGSGFDSKGRPKMLFEPHIFYRELSGAQRDVAVAKGLARPQWKRDYPADSYPRLIEAMKINETAALRSASWGMGQIMGFNHLAAGFDTPQEMVTAFMDDEAEHLESMVSFILVNNLDDEVRAHNWAGFARGYNGPGYKKNNYDTRLAKRYAFWKSKPDTPWSPDMAVEEDRQAQQEARKHVPAPKPTPEPQTPATDAPEPKQGGKGIAAALALLAGAVGAATLGLFEKATSFIGGLF